MPMKPPIHGASQRIARVKSYDKARAKDHGFYQSAEWRGADHKSGLRKTILIRDGYTCTMCGRLSADAVVDHIKNRKRFPELALEPSNLRTLCRSCHNSRTAKGDCDE